MKTSKTSIAPPPFCCANEPPKADESYRQDNTLMAILETGGGSTFQASLSLPILVKYLQTIP